MKEYTITIHTKFGLSDTRMTVFDHILKDVADAFDSMKEVMVKEDEITLLRVLPL